MVPQSTQDATNPISVSTIKVSLSTNLTANVRSAIARARPRPALNTCENNYRARSLVLINDLDIPALLRPFIDGIRRATGP